MKFLDRFFVLIYAFIVALASFLAAAIIGGWTTPLNFFRMYYIHNDLRVPLLVGLGFSFLYSLRLLILATSRHTVPKAVIHQTSLGDIHVTGEAISNMIIKASSQIHGIKEIKPQINFQPDGVKISVRINVTPDLNIPELSKELQETVHNFLEEVAGINVKEIRVLVQNIYQENRGRVE